MKEKELKVNIPKGYEIDKENSTFECIKFKPITITYEDICDNIFRYGLYFTNKDGITQKAINDNLPVNKIFASNNAVSEKQLKKVLAINKLFNIAKYYDEDWEPNWENVKETKFFIYTKMEKYQIQSIQLMNASIPIFKSWEDAQAVIDNPNFQDILDTIFK